MNQANDDPKLLVILYLTKMRSRRNKIYFKNMDFSIQVAVYYLTLDASRLNIMNYDDNSISFHFILVIFTNT